MNEQLDYKQALVQSTSFLEGAAIGGAVILTLWGWNLVHWLCWAAGAGACWGYLCLIAYPKTFWLTVLVGAGMTGTAGYFFGYCLLNTHFLGWVFAVAGALASIGSKARFREELIRQMDLA